MDGRSAAGAQKLVRYPSIVKETQEFGIDKCYIYKQLEGQSMFTDAMGAAFAGELSLTDVRSFSPPPS